MEKKETKLGKFLKSIGLISGGGGVVGIILALSGICLPCVLIPLGFIGAGLLFVFSFVSDYKWWFIGASVLSFLLALSAKSVTVCKDGVCQIDPKYKKRFRFSFSNLKANLIKLNNWKTYVAIPIILLFGALLFTLSLAIGSSGELEMTEAELAKKDPYANIIGKSPVKGPANAKVTIIEYSDYFCPGCLPFYENAIEPVLKKYGNKVRFVSIQVNVLMNLGYSSVHAAYCADEQGKYWEIHDRLMERMRPFVGKPKNWELGKAIMQISKDGTPEYFTKIAEKIDGVDTNKFLECMNSNKYSDRIEETTAAFQKLGFMGVPVIIINGQYFTGNPTQESLENAIDAIIAGKK